MSEYGPGFLDLSQDQRNAIIARDAADHRKRQGESKRKPNGGNAKQPKVILPPWLAGAPCDPRGQPLPVLSNIVLALRTAPAIKDAFAFDAMLCAPVLTMALPATDAGEADLGPYPRPVRDNDVRTLLALPSRIAWLDRSTRAELDREIRALLSDIADGRHG